MYSNIQAFKPSSIKNKEMSQIKPEIESSWAKVLQNDFQSEYFQDLKNFLIEEKKNHTIYPPGSQIFSAFNFTAFDDVKLVIIGQDPYHGDGQAHGLCFSVPVGIKVPPSLRNIFKEINNDIGLPIPESGNLENWAKQGILLINATLTVRANQAGSHQNKGWETFTDSVIKKLSEQKSDLIFMLWGAYAQAKDVLIDETKHHILKATHPSPFSAYRGFLGCKHFSKANEILNSKGLKEIDWRV